MKVSKLLAKSLLAGFVGGLSMTFVACSNETNSVEPGIPVIPGIPSDEIATANPVISTEDLNTLLPNFNYSVYKEGSWYVIRLDMTGVQDPFTGDWVKLYGPGDSRQNVWLSIDDMPKGFSITNTADEEGAQQTKAVDLVFLVDNSGSMSEEANALANQVLAWSQKLEASELDMRFGLVGYDGRITGGINLGVVEELNQFLNNGSSGTSRTMHFTSKEGDDWNTWRSKYWVDDYVDECGVAALRLADENFNFRTGANRAYVNFTDEANYSKGLDEFNVTYVMHKENWPSTKGTIHNVISTDSLDYWLTGVCNENPLLYQRPWNMSDYTGGTTKFVPSSFAGVTLDDLPITGALQNSYIIKFTNIEHLFDGNEHDVHITVKSASPNGEILADKNFNIIFVKP
jgi:hypothetical protein